MLWRDMGIMVTELSDDFFRYIYMDWVLNEARETRGG